MAVTARALAARNIINDVVIFGWTDAERHIIEFQVRTSLPNDIVVCARAIAADADTANWLRPFIIQTQAATKDDGAACFFANHRIVGLTELRGVTTKGN